MRMMRKNEVLERYGKSKSSLHDDIHNGLFTYPVYIGPRAVAWPDFEVEELLRARIAGRTDDEIRELVVQLMKDRQSAIANRSQ